MSLVYSKNSGEINNGYFMMYLIDETIVNIEIKFYCLWDKCVPFICINSEAFFVEIGEEKYIFVSL